MPKRRRTSVTRKISLNKKQSRVARNFVKDYLRNFSKLEAESKAARSQIKDGKSMIEEAVRIRPEAPLIAKAQRLLEDPKIGYDDWIRFFKQNPKILGDWFWKEFIPTEQGLEIEKKEIREIIAKTISNRRPLREESWEKWRYDIEKMMSKDQHPLPLLSRPINFESLPSDKKARIENEVKKLFIENGKLNEKEFQYSFGWIKEMVEIGMKPETCLELLKVRKKRYKAERSLPVEKHSRGAQREFAKIAIDQMKSATEVMLAILKNSSYAGLPAKKKEEFKRALFRYIERWHTLDDFSQRAPAQYKLGADTLDRLNPFKNKLFQKLVPNELKREMFKLNLKIRDRRRQGSIVGLLGEKRLELKRMQARALREQYERNRYPKKKKPGKKSEKKTF